MEEIIKINGGKELEGCVNISGSKNAVLALIPAAILSSGPVTIVGVPNISDVDSIAFILKMLNVNVVREENGHVVIDTSNIKYAELDAQEVTRLRASYYFMGALLGKYKKVKIKMPGGCYLGPRPIDLHLKGFEALGASIKYEQGCYIIEAKELVGSKIFLDISSVGATINIMIASVFAKGRTTIENAAREPEIIDVATLLNKMGAKIRGVGTNVITIDGVDSLVGCFHEIIPDRIEAGTYIILAAACAKNVKVNNIIPQHLEALLSKLDEIGVNMEVGIDNVVIKKSDKFNPVDIKTLPYPGFATDLQQPLTTLLTMCDGESSVSDTIYPERFKHCLELQRMGANIDLNSGRAIIKGNVKLYGDEVTATDLRCGASLVIAGLIAQGETIINEIEHIDRGYEDIEGKLQALGAEIYREKRKR